MLKLDTVPGVSVADVLQALRSGRIAPTVARSRLWRAGLSLSAARSATRAGAVFLIVPWASTWWSAEEREALLALPSVSAAYSSVAGVHGRAVLVGFQALLGVLPPSPRAAGGQQLVDAALVEHAARLIWGGEWQVPLGRCCGLGLRRVQRLAAAVREGRPYPVPPELIAGLALELADHQARIWAAMDALDGVGGP